MNFPSSPTVGQTYALGSKTWVWNGSAWDLQSAAPNNLTLDYVQLNTSATVADAVGRIRWDADQGTADLGLLGGNVVQRLGQTLVAYVTNAEAVTITKGQAVYLFSATGDRASVKLAYNTGDATSAKTFGLVAENIAAGQAGFIMCQGVVYQMDTSTYTAGDSLYLGATAGALTATKPYAPNHLVYIGTVEKANAGNGQIYVRVQNGYELDELHNVSAQSPTNGQTIVYNSSTSLWEKNTVSLTAGVNGTLPVANGGTGVTTSTGTGNVVLSASPTLTGDVTLNAQGDLRFADADSSNWVAFQAPATIAANVTWTLPAADGTSAQVLQTNGSGTLSWATAGGGGSAATPTALGTVYGVTASTNIAVALGYQAATTTVSAGGVTAIGYQALTANTGASNTAVGSSALQANTSATFNTAIGAQAGYSNQAGTYNTFVGYQAGYSNNVAGTGAGCFIGQATGYLSTGAKNTFVGGNAAGYNMTTGASNTILGNFQGNSDGLDMRTLSNYAVIADGDGNRQITMAEGKTLALDSAVPNAGTGITFPATQSASSNANTLDDYEEGTWTPTVGGTATHSSQLGSYVKIGKTVTVTFDIAVTTLGTGSTTNIQGLPFGVGSGAANDGATGYFSAIAINVIGLTCYGAAGTNSIYFNSMAAAGTTSNLNAAIFGNSARVSGSLTYFTS
jgi:hypothetical protein